MEENKIIAPKKFESLIPLNILAILENDLTKKEVVPLKELTIVTLRKFDKSKS